MIIIIQTVALIVIACWLNDLQSLDNGGSREVLDETENKAESKNTDSYRQWQVNGTFHGDKGLPTIFDAHIQIWFSMVLDDNETLLFQLSWVFLANIASYLEMVSKVNMLRLSCNLTYLKECLVNDGFYFSGCPPIWSTMANASI